MPENDELRALIAAVAGRRVEPFGRSLHVHQLDGGRLEAMVYLDARGARVRWEHGKGDCAITGAGRAILNLLHGRVPGADSSTTEELTLYGDLDLVKLAPAIFGSPDRRR